MHQQVRVLDVPSARAAVGGKLIATTSLLKRWSRTSAPASSPDLLSCRIGEHIQEHVRPLAT
jgi:hypothetical protein